MAEATKPAAKKEDGTRTAAQLKKDHTHLGKLCKQGEEIQVTPWEREFLGKRGII